jgi:aspartyl-tRNA(Asn)/glutamyl-tRNA(Gln) amidotransferase subunit C
MLDQAQVHKVATLARLALTPEEETQFASQISGILDYIEQLSELDTTGVKPTTRAIDASNITRKDHQETDANREAILSCAPDRDGDFFKVPRIMGGE